MKQPLFYVFADICRGQPAAPVSARFTDGAGFLTSW